MACILKSVSTNVSLEGRGGVKRSRVTLFVHRQLIETVAKNVKIIIIIMGLYFTQDKDTYPMLQLFMNTVKHIIK